MADDKDYTSLLGRSSGSSWGDIAGAYLSSGRKKDNRARNVLLATLFFNAKEANMQSKVMKNLQELEKQKTLELAKLTKQWDKRTELQTEYDNIQKNGAFNVYKTKLEEDFKKAHLENKEIINMSSGAIAKYKNDWMNNQVKQYENEFMQRYEGVDKGITVKEEFNKPYMDYYKSQKEKIMNPKNVSLVHNMFSKIGIGNKDEALNKKVEELQKARNLNQERIQGFTQADIKQIKSQQVPESQLLGLKINKEDLTLLMANTSLGDTGLDAGRLRQEVRAEWIEGGKTYESAVNAIDAIEEGFNSRQNLADLKAAEARYTAVNPKPTDENKLQQWQMGLDKAKRTALEIEDLSADAIYRANQLYNIASNQGITDKERAEFIQDVLSEDIRKATGAINLNEVKADIIKGRMYKVYDGISSENPTVLNAIKETELSEEKLIYLEQNNPNIYNTYMEFDSLDNFNKNNNLNDRELGIIKSLQEQQYVQNEFNLANLFSTKAISNINLDNLPL